MNLERLNYAIEILRNIRDKGLVEQTKRKGLCDFFGEEKIEYLRNVYGVYSLGVDKTLRNAFEQAAQAVLGYDLVHHAFWLLPLDENGNYTVPTFDFEVDEDGEIDVTPMQDPVTGQYCSEIYVNEPERLTSARLKLLDDMIAYLEKELI